MKIKDKMNRRNFLKLSAASAVITGAAALKINFDKLFTVRDNTENISKIPPYDTKKVFKKCMTCSHTYFYLLNRQFGHLKTSEENASDPLAGGLMGKGYQCGMLWGSTLAVGAESFRRHNNTSQGIATAVIATQRLLESFSKTAGTVNCREITGSDLSNKLGMARLMLKIAFSGFENSTCMNLAEKWAPEAIQTATEGLSATHNEIPQTSISCASEVARKMGASDEEMVMVAGFAGGMGLSGNACGALSAAVWMNTLAWCRKNPGKSGYYNPNSEKIFKAFNEFTGSEILCSKISGQSFKTINNHTDFIKGGGCEKLINSLASS